MSFTNFYVYQYVREDGSPFYIGKGSKNRINESHSPWLEIPAPQFRQVIKDNLSETDAFNLELSLIKKYGRKIDGGILENKKISRWVAQAGWNHSEEAKKKISQSNTGKIRSPEQRKNYSKPKSKEHAEKIKQANLGRPKDNRYKKIAETKSKQRWYNNGKKSIMVVPGTEPEGFKPGRISWRNNNELA
jgi:hypothetical protein